MDVTILTPIIQAQTPPLRNRAHFHLTALDHIRAKGQRKCLKFAALVAVFGLQTDVVSENPDQGGGFPLALGRPTLPIVLDSAHWPGVLRVGGFSGGCGTRHRESAGPPEAVIH